MIITDELETRPAPAPDLDSENRALHELARQIVEDPARALDALSRIAMELCGAGSAGVSLLETDPEGKEVFRWSSIAGAFASHLGGSVPADFSPCGVCLERGEPQLFGDPGRYFTYFQSSDPPVVEALVVPLRAGQVPATIWVIAHTARKRFNREDTRVLSSLANFSAAALSMQLAFQKVETSEAHLRQMADAMPQIVWTATPDGRIDYYNQRWFDYTGLTPEKSYGAGGCESILHPDDRERVEAAWEHGVRNGEMHEIEMRWRRADGAYRWHLERGVPLRDASGQIIKWVGAVTDIDDHMRTESALEQARDAAEAANQAKDRFLAALSHELRTPLTPVLLAIAAMEMNPELPDSLRDEVDMIRRNIELESKLIDDLLDLSRVINGRLRLRSCPARVHDKLRHVLQICESDYLEKRLDVELDLNAFNDCVLADPARLQQVFWNLIKNAIKFTPEGGQIIVRTRNAHSASAAATDVQTTLAPSPPETSDAQRLIVEVCDTGVGIDPDVLSRIFDVFEQGGPQISRQFGGLGMGLAISKAVVDMHGGRLRAHSDGVGRGARFTVELATASPAVAGESADEPATEPNRRRNGRKLLLVEDHRDTAGTLARVLERAGYSVTTAHSVSAAMRHVADGGFDLLISDLGLPDASGYDLMQRIREHHGILGIALSGHGREEDIERSRAAGFAEHLVKPVNVEHLDAAIQRIIQSKTPPALDASS